MFSCALFTYRVWGRNNSSKILCLRTSLEVWCKWIVFVPNFPFFRIPIELHNTVLWYLVVYYPFAPKIWRPRDKNNEHGGRILRMSFKIENYLVRLILCFLAPISGKEHKFKYIMTVKEVSWMWKKKEGQRRDRKRDRQKKQMTDNIVSPSLPDIRNQNHQNPSLGKISKLIVNIIYFHLTVGDCLT